MLGRLPSLVFAFLGTAGVLIATAGTVSASPPPINLRTVSYQNRTIPGSTCLSDRPITLHRGHGIGGTPHDRLVVDVYKPTFADITHDNHVEAFLPVECSTGGGTAAAQVKFTYVVFTASGRAVTVLGVIAPQQQWRDAHATLMSPVHVSHQTVTVTEYVYVPADADCCSSLTATTKWYAAHGQLRVKSSHLSPNDLIIGNAMVGQARLGMTGPQLRAKYPRAVYHRGTSNTCAAYTAGREFDQLTGKSVSFVAYVRAGRIVQIRPRSRYAVTTRGIGQYSSLADIKAAYPHAVTRLSPHRALVVQSHYRMVIKLSTDLGGYASSVPTIFSGPGTKAPC